jgi:hypothetical protein
LEADRQRWEQVFGVAHDLPVGGGVDLESQQEAKERFS